MTEQSAFGGILVVELGNRIAAGVAGSLLAQAGADVVVVEAESMAPEATKWDHRALATAGKFSISGSENSADRAFLAELVASADVIITSDLDQDWHKSLLDGSNARQILCDISAFGSTGPLAGKADSDFLVQAVTGVMDVTGLPTEAPTPVGLPVIEVSAGLYAASAVTATLRFRDLGRGGQKIEISLYDCAVNTQATFLPFHFVGRTPRRAGNRHSMCAPWNCYQAKDRWILVCSATNDQWLRLCEVMQRPDLAAKPDLTTLADRLAKCDEVDAAVQLWVGQRTFAECIEALGGAGLACGPIVPVAALEEEPNLAHRNFVRRLVDPVSGHKIKIPASPFHPTPALGRTPDHIPTPGDDLDVLKAKVRRRHAISPGANTSGAPAAPLSDIRVLEIGQYTTAPLAARHLATLGADVLKIEPPQGESSRFWPPHKNGQGYFFTLSNSDKQSVMIDLGTDSGCRDFEALIREADVFVENTKPGSLERRGFGPRDLAKINPRLIYCAISGFGYSSAYPQRPAFDTVIQAMSGVMDLTQSGSVPVKAGISIADIIGGQFALLAILLALKHRDATGKGAFIDLAMQEACAWSTQFAWNDGAPAREHVVIQCQDGFVAAETSLSDVTRILNGRDAKTSPSEDLLARLVAGKVRARRVLNIPEVVNAPQLAARQLILWRSDLGGTEWPLLGSPMRLSGSPPRVQAPIEALGSGNARIGLITGNAAMQGSGESKQRERIHV